jgi:2-polyprenyl-6-methoxyphenol hydroxylase-like FAD-dependent oxidoreductase
LTIKAEHFMKVVVIGASVAGLLAARALTDVAESIVVVDRDDPPDAAVARKCAPQGRHVHGVLAGGLDVLQSFFPGILDDLVTDGSHVVDAAQDVLWFNNGGWRLRCQCGIKACIQTRPLLELHIRRRVRNISNVRLLYGTRANGMHLDPARLRITGVLLTNESGEETLLPADLIVDCSGRGSQTPTWLAANGIGKPLASTIAVNVGYSTQYFRLSDPSALGWHAMLILSRPPSVTRLGAGFLVEGNALQLTLGGLFRDYPPDDEGGFLKFAESLEHPALFQAIQKATPTSTIFTYRFPAHVWNHYDRLSGLPENLLVMGDALCSFNPIYGQGMTVAALEAQVQARCASETKDSTIDTKRIQDQYFRRISGITKAAWAMATGADLAYPQAEVRRPFGSNMFNRYIEHLVSLTCSDEKALMAWNQVTQMKRSMSILFTPSIATRVLRRAVTGQPR